jgi:hypothetical protein
MDKSKIATLQQAGHDLMRTMHRNSAQLGCGMTIA